MSRKRGRKRAEQRTSAPAFVYGVQPVLEAIRSGRRVRAISIARGPGGATQDILQAASGVGVAVHEVKKDELTRRCGSEGHQGVLAEIDPEELEAYDIDDIVDRAEETGEDPLVVLLDGIQDPHNLGAILRSVYALGAHGVVLPKNRSASITPAVVRASAGAALSVPVATVTNLKLAIDRLVERKIWTAAAVMEGTPAHQARLEGPLALVIGGEGAGVRPSLAEKCDFKVSIPLAHGFDSLNASVAAGILLWEVQRQRLDSEPPVP